MGSFFWSDANAVCGNITSTQWFSSCSYSHYVWCLPSLCPTVQTSLEWPAPISEPTKTSTSFFNRRALSHGRAAVKHQRVQRFHHDAAPGDRVSLQPELRHRGGSRLGPVAGAALLRVLLRLSQPRPGSGVHGQPDLRHRGWERGHAHRLCTDQAVPDPAGILER